MAEPRLRGTIGAPLRFDARDLQAATFGDRHDLERARLQSRVIYTELGREGWIDGHPSFELRHATPVITDLPEPAAKRAPVPPRARKKATAGRRSR